MENELTKLSEEKYKSALQHFSEELKKVRTGRANSGMLDDVVVEAYGVRMPLKQVASIIAPEAQLLQITPFDPNNIQAVSAAIRNNPALGLNPSDDGHVVRIPIPPLNEERRREIARSLGEKVELTMIVMRGIRHDILKQGELLIKEKKISEDNYKRLQKLVDDMMNQYKLKVEAMAKTKENEILSM